MKNKLNNKGALSLVIRYAILLLLGINLDLIYKILTPITVNFSAFILRLYDAGLIVNNSIIVLNSTEINIISACVAGSAYLLLLILNLSTKMNYKQRIKSLLFILISFFIINVIRIIVFSILYVSGFQYFDITHSFFWYIGSTILLILLWFVNIKLFKITNIPIFTDGKYLISDIRK